MSALTHGGRQLSGRESWAPSRQKAGDWTAQDSHGATLASARILTLCGLPAFQTERSGLVGEFSHNQGGKLGS